MIRINNMEEENTLSNSEHKSVSSQRSLKSKTINSSKSSKKIKPDLESEDISLSQLEMMANKKKLNKAPPSLIDSKSEQFEVKHTSVSLSSSESSSSSTDDVKRKRRKEKEVQRENQNDLIRKEKSEYLFKFNKLNVKGKWSSLRLDMNSSLDEIRNEYERIRNEIQTERSVAFFKRMLLLGVQGIEMLNTKFDPLGVDLDGWSEAMGYSMENQEYDEVMAELYEKYKGRGQMSPEVKLIFMIISSATMFTISKKLTKMDSNNALGSLLGGLMGKSNNQQQYNQQQYNQQQYYQQQQYNQQHNYIPDPSELRGQREYTETTDDGLPSKMSGPSKNIQDNIDLDNILRTMQERKREKQNEITETSDDVLKNIDINNKKRGRGRPKKAVSNLRFN